MKKALVVGGNSGVGLSMSLQLLKRGYKHIYIVGKDSPDVDDISDDFKREFIEKTSFFRVDLTAEDYTVFDTIQDIDSLIITAGFGRADFFENLLEAEIKNLVKCNELAVIQIIKKYYDKLKSDKNFYCAIMGSIAGHISSPLFSVYGAAKAGVCHFIENINSELAYSESPNRILDISPGALQGTKFHGNKTDVNALIDFSNEALDKMFNRETLYIPKFDEIYKNVIEKYNNDPIKSGVESCEYKIKNNRLNKNPQVIVGYLSGTFDLFHIGHLNLLKRAKEHCDYLVVGVHESGAWKGKETFIPFEERKAIIGSVKYVDKVIKSYTEDIDAYEEIKYHRLFVGSDYKGTERFNRYEKYFENKNVKIIYFPYTQGTSSTQLRDILSSHKNKNEDK